jgi:hypothetical protein
LPLRLDFVYRKIDPLIAFLAGLALRNLGFGALGLCLMISAIALFIVEEHSFQRQMERDLDTLDSLIEAQQRKVVVEHFEKTGKPRPQPKSVRETGGISTGVDAEILEHVERRKREAQNGDNRQGAA